MSARREGGSSNGYEVEIGKELYRLQITRLGEHEETNHGL